MALLILDSTVKGLSRLHTQAMMDTVTLMTYQAIDTDQYNQPVDQWVDWQEIQCKFRWLSSDEVEASAINAVAEIETDNDTSIDSKNRIRLTHLHGDGYSEQPVFEIASGPQKHYIGTIYQVRYVNDGSTHS